MFGQGGCDADVLNIYHVGIMTLVNTLEILCSITVMPVPKCIVMFCGGAFCYKHLF
jgi:hypothetical protein